MRRARRRRRKKISLVRWWTRKIKNQENASEEVGKEDDQVMRD